MPSKRNTAGRQPVLKTLKMYVGGRFIRSESGRVIAATSRRGDPMYVPRASRKDLREAVATARKAAAGWAGRTAMNKGQILYRLAEMIEDRAAGLPTPEADAFAASDRAVHHAGWTDKIGAVLAAVNPVATGHINYARLRAMGIVVAAPAAADGLLGMVEATAAALVTGNPVILLVPTEASELAAAYAELLATSDVPAGSVAVLMGDVPAVLEWADKHDDVDAIYVAEAALTPERLAETQASGARVLRRVIVVPDASAPADALTLQRLAEVQTVWISA